MKRVLAVVVILVIVGSALEFKVKGEIPNVVCYSGSINPVATCPTGGIPIDLMADPLGGLSAILV